MACPHWVVAPTGVLKVKCSTSGRLCAGLALPFSIAVWSVPWIQSTDPLATLSASNRGLAIETVGGFTSMGASLYGLAAVHMPTVFESAQTSFNHR
jgi:hypothetical protein